MPAIGTLARKLSVVSAQDGGDSPRPSKAPPLRVLVVDDEEDIRVLLRAQLERAGYTVAGEAADGTEALAHCDRDLPDAVILDLPVTFAEAALGATVAVPTLDGGSVKVKVAPGTPSGRCRRGRPLRGRSISAVVWCSALYWASHRWTLERLTRQRRAASAIEWPSATSSRASSRR